MTRDELSVRRFNGNGDVLCSFKCPFVKIVDNQTAFCFLYRKTLNYYDTGNNEICERCFECAEEKLRTMEEGRVMKDKIKERIR